MTKFLLIAIIVTIVIGFILKIAEFSVSLCDYKIIPDKFFNVSFAICIFTGLSLIVILYASIFISAIIEHC